MGDTPKTDGDCSKTKTEPVEEPTWERDQKEHEYYYDDAHGYETFDPEKEDDDEEAN
jgi:hypothetical protein